MPVPDPDYPKSTYITGVTSIGSSRRPRRRSTGNSFAEDGEGSKLETTRFGQRNMKG